MHVMPTYVHSSLVICESMLLLARGHPEALRELQRQMRLVNDAYGDATVLRLTDEVVRAATILHGPPGLDDEFLLRQRAKVSLSRLRQALALLPAPRPPPIRPPKRTPRKVR
jgi:hypothetical protein